MIRNKMIFSIYPIFEYFNTRIVYKTLLRLVQKYCVHFILIIFLRCNLHDDFGLFMLLETTTPRVNEYFILEEFLEFKESSFLECLFVFLHNDLNKPH